MNKIIHTIVFWAFQYLKLENIWSIKHFLNEAIWVSNLFAEFNSFAGTEIENSKDNVSTVKFGLIINI